MNFLIMVGEVEKFIDKDLDSFYSELGGFYDWNSFSGMNFIIDIRIVSIFEGSVDFFFILDGGIVMIVLFYIIKLVVDIEENCWYEYVLLFVRRVSILNFFLYFNYK